MMRKGQLLPIMLSILAIGFTTSTLLLAMQGNNYREQINLQEIEMMEGKNSVYLSENSMDATWFMSTVQSTFFSGETGVGNPLWFLLDNTKESGNSGYNAPVVDGDDTAPVTISSTTSTITITPPDNGYIQCPNGYTYSSNIKECVCIIPAICGMVVDEAINSLISKITANLTNPFVYKPNGVDFGNFVRQIIAAQYLPTMPLLYYVRGVRIEIGNFVVQPYLLDSEGVKGIVAQDLISIGDKVTAAEFDYNSTITVITKMLTMLTAGHIFVDGNMELAKKTETYAPDQRIDGEFIYKSSDFAFSTTSSSAFLATVTKFLTSKKNAMLDAAGDAIVTGASRLDVGAPLTNTQASRVVYSDMDTKNAPDLVVPGSDDKLVGERGGLELRYSFDITLIEKMAPEDVEWKYYEEKDAAGQPKVDGNKEFKREPYVLFFKTKSSPAVLDCGKNNGYLFNYEIEKDMLCLGDKIWTCKTNIEGIGSGRKLAGEDVGGDGNANPISEGTFRCVQIPNTAQRFCKIYRDTRDVEKCCVGWAGSWIFSRGSQYGPGTFCIGDGTCDNGVDNKDDSAKTDRGERCEVNGLDNKNDCKPGANEKCCDPEEGAASKKGYVPQGHVDSGTECSVCQASGQYGDDNSKCPPDNRYCSGETAVIERYACSGGSCIKDVTTENCEYASTEQSCGWVLVCIGTVCNQEWQCTTVPVIRGSCSGGYCGL